MSQKKKEEAMLLPGNKERKKGTPGSRKSKETKRIGKKEKKGNNPEKKKKGNGIENQKNQKEQKKKRGNGTAQ